MLGRKSKQDEGQRTVAAAQAQGIPPPQIVYVQTEKKRGGCLKFVIGSLVVVGAVVILAGVLLSGGSDGSVSDGSTGKANLAANTTPTPAPQGTESNPASIGGTVTADGLEIMLNAANTAETATAGFSVPDEGNVYVVLDVTIRNVSNEKKSFNALYWSAKDMERGYTFDDAMMASTGQDISAGDLSPSDLVRGNVVLEVKADTQALRIKYDTSPLGGKNMYWAVRM